MHLVCRLSTSSAGPECAPQCTTSTRHPIPDTSLCLSLMLRPPVGSSLLSFHVRPWEYKLVCREGVVKLSGACPSLRTTEAVVSHFGPGRWGVLGASLALSALLSFVILPHYLLLALTPKQFTFSSPSFDLFRNLTQVLAVTHFRIRCFRE